MHSDNQYDGRNSFRRQQRASSGGFSLVEMAVAAGIAASVLTAAALVFSAAAMNQRRHGTFGSIDIGPASANHYGLSSTKVDSYIAPNYGRASRADLLRDVFWEDIGSASAVYCLGRTALNTVRPVYIPLDASIDGRTLDSPEAFRLHLASVLTSSSTIFKSWRGTSGTYENGSIFVLQPSGFENFLAVRAIYDIDIQSTTNPLGTYVSVKRYSWNTLTDYYDAFYPAGGNAVPFKPLFAFHERRARLSHDEGSDDNYKTAVDMPFYFIWWPDPASPALAKQTELGANSYGGTIPVGDPNPIAEYGGMAGRTAYFFTVPLFPSQQ